MVKYIEEMATEIPAIICENADLENMIQKLALGNPNAVNYGKNILKYFNDHNRSIQQASLIIDKMKSVLMLKNPSIDIKENSFNSMPNIFKVLVADAPYINKESDLEIISTAISNLYHELDNIWGYGKKIINLLENGPSEMSKYFPQKDNFQMQY